MSEEKASTIEEKKRITWFITPEIEKSQNDASSRHWLSTIVLADDATDASVATLINCGNGCIWLACSGERHHITGQKYVQIYSYWDQPVRRSVIKKRWKLPSLLCVQKPKHYPAIECYRDIVGERKRWCGPFEYGTRPQIFNGVDSITIDYDEIAISTAKYEARAAAELADWEAEKAYEAVSNVFAKLPDGTVSKRDLMAVIDHMEWYKERRIPQEHDIQFESGPPINYETWVESFKRNKRKQ